MFCVFNFVFFILVLQSNDGGVGLGAINDSGIGDGSETIGFDFFER